MRGPTTTLKGIGTRTSPYIISNLTELNSLRNYITKEFIYVNITAKIDCSPCIDWKDENGSGFEPIGTRDMPFNGCMYGYSISTFYTEDVHILNLYIKDNRESVGLFAYITDVSFFNNLRFYNSKIYGNRYVGSISGSIIKNTHDIVNTIANNASYTFLNNIYISKSIIKGEHCVGGIFGIKEEDTNKIYATQVSITSKNISGHIIGGFIGICHLKIKETTPQHTTPYSNGILKEDSAWFSSCTITGTFENTSNGLFKYNGGYFGKLIVNGNTGDNLASRITFFGLMFTVDINGVDNTDILGGFIGYFSINNLYKDNIMLRLENFSLMIKNQYFNPLIGYLNNLNPLYPLSFSTRKCLNYNSTFIVGEHNEYGLTAFSDYDCITNISPSTSDGVYTKLHLTIYNTYERGSRPIGASLYNSAREQHEKRRTIYPRYYLSNHAMPYSFESDFDWGDNPFEAEPKLMLGNKKIPITKSIASQGLKVNMNGITYSLIEDENGKLKIQINNKIYTYRIE